MQHASRDFHVYDKPNILPWYLVGIMDSWTKKEKAPFLPFLFDKVKHWYDF